MGIYSQEWDDLVLGILDFFQGLRQRTSRDSSENLRTHNRGEVGKMRGPEGGKPIKF